MKAVYKGEEFDIDQKIDDLMRIRTNLQKVSDGLLKDLHKLKELRDSGIREMVEEK